MPRHLLPLAWCLFAAAVSAQTTGFGAVNERNHPELDWQVAETEHFEIIYPAHLAGLEAEAAAVAEASYDSLAAYFGVTITPKIRLYFSDEDEISNGSAYPIGRAGYSTMWVHTNDYAENWTGDVKWLRKVIAHELAHLFHFRTVRGPLGLLDNLLGEPLPSFWAEGLAQYTTERWDAQRGDRWLRTAAFEDRLNPDDGGSAWNGRLRYALGNSQVRYLAQRYGDSTITRILRHRRPAVPGLPGSHDFYAAFRAVTGRPYREFNEEWRKHVNVHYNTLAGQMERVDSLQVRRLALPGQYVYAVAYSPDTSRVAAVVLTSLVRPVRRLFVMHNTPVNTAEARGVRVLAEGAITGPIAWSPDGRQIAYTRNVRGRHGSLLNDLYVVDVETGRKRRLTESRRASAPSFSPDGRTLAFIGSEGSTANLFLLDLETGRETALTRFVGDVQLTGARWSPRGDRIAVARFDEAGQRDLLVVEVATGGVLPLATGEGLATEDNDSRGPVWRPDGAALAFTSFRDDVPNVFVVPLVEGPEVAIRADVGIGTNGHAPDTTASDTAEVHEPQGEERVTYLFTGASVQDWLPPDSLHPAGRLVLVSTETKQRDRVFVVDAARRPTVDGPAAPAPGYHEWTEHRPPHALPPAMPPDPALVQRRYRYNSLRNLTHGITLPLPYADPEQNDYGVFANSIWLEPLGKHQLFVLGGVSFTRFADKSFLLLSYTNNTLAPSLTLNLYRFPGPGRFYGSALLVENLTGGDLGAVLPLDLTDAPFTTTLAGLRLRYAYAEPYDLDNPDLDAAGGPLPEPEEGFRADVQVGFAWKRQRPYRYNTVAPLDGTGLRVRVTAGVPVLGAENRFVLPDAAAYWISPTLGIGNVFVYGRATARFGESLAQDVLGLSRYDDVDLQIPFVGTLTLDDAERVRGYRRYAVGDRVLFGTIEYRTPPVLDLDTRLFGFVELGQTSFVGFVDAGMVWTGSDVDAAIRRTGVGLEAKNELGLGPFRLTHALGVALPWHRVGAEDLVWDDADLYYRLQATVPF
ncbi:MAG TPA: DPP IV N-terminal domain-containing protein [Rubricoccaceae bacterium]|nr:DPP IV N-terminal domain-containing protein [Rubricoccaceae bacterium]